MPTGSAPAPGTSPASAPRKPVRPPLSDADVASLRAGDLVAITGVLYTARDAAHALLIAALDAGQPLPFDVKGQIIYYVGPTPPHPGEVIGSAGPTTGGRMDAYAPRLLALGLKGMIGKGYRNATVKEALKTHKAIYFGAVGGAGAYLRKHIVKVEMIAYAELGTEAVRRLEVVDFPAIVINDCHGGDLYAAGQKQYQRA
ncbi:MAG: Fe-S-containing hydro-lyase [Dehalococcoidia bacterium]|nr:Fe-S-containing hydro-lyase [Dehalococcoidia bacterium]